MSQKERKEEKRIDFKEIFKGGRIPNMIKGRKDDGGDVLAAASEDSNRSGSRGGKRPRMWT